VAEQQEGVLAELGKLQRPTQLIDYLDRTLGGSWKKLSDEYKGLHGRLARLKQELAAFEEGRDQHYTRIRELNQARIEAEVRKGEQFRAEVFEKEPGEGANTRRAELGRAVDETVEALDAERGQLRELRQKQYSLTRDPEIQQIHARRRAIEQEAELKRARLIQSAVFAARGLHHAAIRPSAWWFPLVCPDGLWFRETIETAQCYLEPLI
jgi:chromosome segregation ATPase